MPEENKNIVLSGTGMIFQFLTPDGSTIIDPRYFVQTNPTTNKIDLIYLPEDIGGGIEEIETYPI